MKKVKVVMRDVINGRPLAALDAGHRVDDVFLFGFEHGAVQGPDVVGHVVLPGVDVTKINFRANVQS